MYSKNIHENYSLLIIQAKATTSGGTKKFICYCMHIIVTAETRIEAAVTDMNGRITRIFIVYVDQ